MTAKRPPCFPTASKHDRDHLVTIHPVAIESHLYKHGYCTAGHMITVLTGNYTVAMDQEKQSMVKKGFPCALSTVEGNKRYSVKCTGMIEWMVN